MKIFLVLAVLVAATAASNAAAAPAPPRVLAIHYTADVNPITQDWLNSQLDRARSGHYDAAVIILDTPGGLEESMRKIVQKELSVSRAGVPVIVYVSPGGARAASAGVWISEAADVLAMAPNTNIGSSTPINSNGANVGTDLRRKIVNDAAASLRGLAQSHGRNAHWADSAVRVAKNLTDVEALHQNVIDVIAPTLPALLTKIDGTTTVPEHLKLHTAGATIVDTRPGFFTRLLSTLLDPNLLSLLFLAGIAGVGFEIFHPGVVLPGALGAVSLLIALFGFSILPLSWTALGLIALGIGLLVVDTQVVSHGALTVSGLIAMGIGFATLFHNAGPYQTSIPLVVILTVVIGGVWVILVSKGMALRRAPVAVGPEEIVGMEGVVHEGGMVYVNGELWRVRSAERLKAGQHVLVDDLDGLVLDVHPV